MRSFIQPTAVVASLFVGSSSAFHPFSFGRRHLSDSALALSSSTYLDLLSQAVSGGATTSSPAPPSVPVNRAAPPIGSAATTPTTTTGTGSTAPFSYAPLDYFGLDKLESKGPRATADWGQPRDATRKLDDDGTFRVDSWFCSEGGWPSPNPKAHTEIFYVLEGHGCLGDADGVKHYFGPGDTVVIPKGHTGRWDVWTPMHKVWAVNDHDRIEETSNPIRVQVDYYHKFAPQYLATGDPLYQSAHQGVAYQTFYNVGPTQVGVWTCGPASFPVSSSNARIFFHLLEGVVFVTDGASGEARRCVPGDTVMLPRGWYGHIDVVETAKKLWTTAA